LFTRTKHGMIPTPEGEQFLKEAQMMLKRLNDLAVSFRATSNETIQLACVPSSLYVNTALELAKQLPDLRIQCQEYYDCRALFQTVASGKAAAAFITMGTEMKADMQQYLEHQKLTYHMIAQSPAYGVIHRDSPLYHPETIPASIEYEKASMMLNVSYYEPIAIRFQQKLCAFPAARRVCHGTGRAANLDRLTAQPDLVMMSCHVYSSVLDRNHLAAVPFQPEIPLYEYGYVTRISAENMDTEDCVLKEMSQLLIQEFHSRPYDI